MDTSRCELLIVGHAGSGTTLACERLSKRGVCVVWNDFVIASANERTCKWAGVPMQTEPGPLSGWDWWGLKDPHWKRWQTQIDKFEPEHILVMVREPHAVAASAIRRGYRGVEIRPAWELLTGIADLPNSHVVMYNDLVKPGFEFPTWNGWRPKTYDGGVGHLSGPLQASELLCPLGEITDKSIDRWQDDTDEIKHAVTDLTKNLGWVYERFNLQRPDFLCLPHTG